MNIVKSKSFKNGTVYCLRLEDGMLVETTDTFLPYYTKDAIGRKQNFLDNDNLKSFRTLDDWRFDNERMSCKMQVLCYR